MFRARHDGIAAALSGDHRNRQGSRRLPLADHRFLRGVRRQGRRAPRSRPNGRRALRRRSAVLRLLHASACAARAPLPDRSHSRRHRHVGLLVADRPADRPGRRRADRAAGHDERVRTDAPACRHRRRRHHEGWPQPAQDPPGAGSDRQARHAPSMSSAAPWPTAVSMRLADKPDDEAPYFAIVLVAGWSGRPPTAGAEA